ncbi:MAG: MBOAT family O-acyltransferase [Actinomycetota bacterium]
MVFNSLEYALFFPTVLALYWLVRSRKPQNALLLIASYLFYGAWDARFLVLMLFSTVTDFSVGRWLERTEDDRRRKRIFLISLVVNLGILGFFKYFDFFIDSTAGLLETFGLQPNLPTLRILLPVGISFYTFHGISYTFDVYRRHIRATNNILDFACFIAFFPQLVAGPIGRAHIQLPQFEKERTRPTAEGVRSALFLILLGLFKKVAIADALAPYVDQAFRGSGRAGALQLLVGMYAFALQIYGDFSGYTDMARGSARLLGIELIRNFEQPYLSRNITEFWRRWHISLSTWLRDYLYVSLGGNRGGGRLLTYRNILITMLLGGLWHGAAWTFVIWGGLHGLFLVGHRLLGRQRPITTEPGRVGWRDALPILATFHLVSVAWVFFRAASLEQALSYLGGIFTLRGGPLNPDAAALLVAAAVAVLGIDLMQRNTRTEEAVLDWGPVARGVAYAVMIVAIVVFSGGTPVPFIYFQF